MIYSRRRSKGSDTEPHARPVSIFRQDIASNDNDGSSCEESSRATQRAWPCSCKACIQSIIATSDRRGLEDDVKQGLYFFLLPLRRSVNVIASSSTRMRSKSYVVVLLVLGFTHLLNDLMQSLISASYPILKDAYALDFVQIGMITLTFQIAGSLLQPVIGMVTDKRPAPFSPVVGMMFTLSGLVSLAFAHSYAVILVSVALIGIGSSIFHPEATRMARYAAGGRRGLHRVFFRVGGQAGGSLGPVLAALILVPWGQQSLARFAVLALLAMSLPVWIGSKQNEIRAAFTAVRAGASAGGESVRHAPATIAIGLVVLTLLMFTKNAYGESFRSFYTFYLMDKFGLSIPSAQMMLFYLSYLLCCRGIDWWHRGRSDRPLQDHLDFRAGALATDIDASLCRSFLDRSSHRFH